MSVTDDSGNLGGSMDRSPFLDGGAPREALQRVFEKLTRMSEELLEIEDWFDARSRDLSAAPHCRVSAAGDRFVSLEQVDEVIGRERPGDCSPSC